MNIYVGNLAFGVDSDESNGHFKGNLDEIVIYTYARTPAQVKTDLPSSQTAVVYGEKTEDWLTNGLVGYWPMDESSSIARVQHASDSAADPASATFSNTPDIGNLLARKAF